MTDQTIHILMTGAGAPGAPGILKCLKREPRFGITLADANSRATGRYLHDRFIQIPPGNDPGFADQLLSICREKKIDIVLPLVTKELIPLARRVQEFEKSGIRVLVSPAASLEIANDKSKLYQFMEWRDIAVPSFRVVETITQFRTAVKELGFPETPVCFKPSVSNGSRGFRVISDAQQAREDLFAKKPGDGTITLAATEELLSAGTFPELLVSEFLPGREFSVDCVVNRGEPVLILPRSRDRMVNGISVEGEFIADDAIIRYCSRIVSELRLHGNIGIQLREDRSGRALLLEINPRVQGTISAGLGAGVNLPVLAVRQEMNMPIETGVLTVKWGTRFSRYWDETFY